MVQDKQFRQDLLYRINTIQIELPPLRKRQEDIEILANFFISKYALKYKKTCARLQQKALDRLRKYEWPGNVRELQHTMEKAVILCEGREISPTDLNLFQSSQPAGRENLTLEEMEKRMVMNELKNNNQSLSIAAKNLGISRTTLYKKMKKYGL